MSTGVLVVAVAILFVIGNIMGLKPKASEVRTGEMRLLARKLGLNPKLVPIPSWLTGAVGKGGMIAQYTLISDDWRLVAKQVGWTDGGWRSDVMPQIVPPDFCQPYLRGVVLKANCVMLYWQDELYAKSFSIRDERAMMIIEQDLMCLKEFLVSLGNQS